MEGLTASEIAGFGVGALLLCATIAAPRVDGFIASSQRRSLSMCKRCGDLRMVACSQCKGVGSVRKGGIFTFGMLDNIYESLGAESKATNLVACTKCLSKGHLLCPECSKLVADIDLYSSSNSVETAAKLLLLACVLFLPPILNVFSRVPTY